METELYRILQTALLGAINRHRVSRRPQILAVYSTAKLSQGVFSMETLNDTRVSEPYIKARIKAQRKGSEKINLVNYALLRGNELRVGEVIFDIVFAGRHIRLVRR